MHMAETESRRAKINVFYKNSLGKDFRSILFGIFESINDTLFDHKFDLVAQKIQGNKEAVTVLLFFLIYVPICILIITKNAHRKERPLCMYTGHHFHYVHLFSRTSVIALKSRYGLGMCIYMYTYV